MKLLTEARQAGLIYLVVVLAGIFSLAYAPSQLIVLDDAARTVRNLTEHETLYRASIVGAFVCYLAFLALPFALHRLLAPAGAAMAAAMVVLAVVSVPISMAALLHKLDVLTLLGDRPWVAGLSAEQVQVQVMASLASHGNGMLVAEIFWGAWLFPFGWLVYRSGRLPKVLGVFLMLGAAGYLTSVFGTVLVPGFRATTVAEIASYPASIGEIGICLWLVVFGAREARPSDPPGILGAAPGNTG